MQDSPLAILQAANLYVFTMGNPVMWIDPSGLTAESPSGNAGTRRVFDGGRWVIPTSRAHFNALRGSRRNYSAFRATQNAIDALVSQINAIMGNDGLPNDVSSTVTANPNVLGATTDERTAHCTDLSSVTINDDNTHSVVTSIITSRGTAVASWWISLNWTIGFNFTRNDFSHIDAIGGVRTLATEMLQVTRSFDRRNMSGRTVDGMMVDLLSHYLGNASPANMGGIRRNRPGHDGNAWHSEAIALAFPLRQCQDWVIPFLIDRLL
jgi:hypothetical protein